MVPLFCFHRLPLVSSKLTDLLCMFDTLAILSSSKFMGCNSTCIGKFCTSQSSGIASLAFYVNSSLTLNGTLFNRMLIACDGGPGGYCSSQGGAVFAVVSDRGQKKKFNIQLQISSVVGSFCNALVSSRSAPLSGVCVFVFVFVCVLVCVCVCVCV